MFPIRHKNKNYGSTKSVKLEITWNCSFWVKKKKVFSYETRVQGLVILHIMYNSTQKCSILKYIKCLIHL